MVSPTWKTTWLLLKTLNINVYMALGYIVKSKESEFHFCVSMLVTTLSIRESKSKNNPSAHQLTNG